jgi:hypothetical protein
VGREAIHGRRDDQRRAWTSTDRLLPSFIITIDPTEFDTNETLFGDRGNGVRRDRYRRWTDAGSAQRLRFTSPARSSRSPTAPRERHPASAGRVAGGLLGNRGFAGQIAVDASAGLKSPPQSSKNARVLDKQSGLDHARFFSSIQEKTRQTVRAPGW